MKFNRRVNNRKRNRMHGYLRRKRTREGRKTMKRRRQRGRAPVPV